MGVLQDFVESLPWEIDFDAVLDPDVGKIESTTYTKPVVYKYFSAARRSFFEHPRVRFTQKVALNDPFELAPRWRSASTESLRKIMTERLRQLFPMMRNDKTLVARMLQEQCKSRGIILSIEQIGSVLSTPQGEQVLIAGLANAEQVIFPMIEYVFDEIEKRFQEHLDGLVSKWGVLSLSERPLSALMWAHYADQGAGFVIGFDATHPFFFSKETQNKNLLRKVLYSDNRIENFWNNPYYLFMVKNADWSYEQEWRMFKDLSECDEQIENDGVTVALCDMPCSAIKEVYFGYRWQNADLDRHREGLIRQGCEATFDKAYVDLETGRLVPQSFSEIGSIQNPP